MREYGFSLTRILPYKEDLFFFGRIRVSENSYSRKTYAVLHATHAAERQFSEGYLLDFRRNDFAVNFKSLRLFVLVGNCLLKISRK